ncbi:hypothetical protein GCM10020331_037730 [Ectobacillus funiculus]
MGEKNGEVAGTTGQSLRVEAIQIRLIPKQTGFAGIVAGSQTAQKNKSDNNCCRKWRFCESNLFGKKRK